MALRIPLAEDHAKSPTTQMIRTLLFLGGVRLMGGGGILEEVLREPSNERTLPAVRGQSDPRELGAQLDDAHLARTQLRRWPLLLLPGSLLLDSPPPACFRALLPVPLPVPLPQECFQEELTLEHESIAWMQKRRNPLMYGGKRGGGG